MKASVRTLNMIIFSFKKDQVCIDFLSLVARYLPAMTTAFIGWLTEQAEQPGHSLHGFGF